MDPRIIQNALGRIRDRVAERFNAPHQTQGLVHRAAQPVQRVIQQQAPRIQSTIRQIPPVMQRPQIAQRIQPRMQPIMDRISNTGRELGQAPIMDSIYFKSPTFSQAAQAVGKDSILSKFLTGKASDIPGQISSDFESYRKPMFAGKNATPEEKALAQSNFKQVGLDSVSIGGFTKPAFSKAANYLTKTADKKSIQKIMDFVIDVQKTGGKKNYGQLGQEMESIAADVYGKQARGLSNKQLANLFDVTLKSVGKKGKFGLGLATENLRPGVLPQAAVKLKAKGQFKEPTIGELQRMTQSPDLTKYENALNTGDNKLLEQLSKQYKNDTRFQVHKSLNLQRRVIDDITGGFEAGRKAREASANVGAGLKARSQLIDRLSPIYDFVKKGGLEKAPTENNPYKQMRLLAGTSGKVETFLDQKLAPILKRELPRQNDLSALLVLDREQELIGRGLKRTRNLAQINQGVQELRAKYGDEGFATLQQSAKEVRNVGSQLLDELKNAGVIDDASYQAIKQNNQFYAPFEAVSHMADNIEKGHGMGSFNVASQDVVKRVGDYIGDVADPLESLLRKIPKVIALTEKNKALQSLVNLRKTNPDVYGDLIVPVKSGTLQDKGIINVFENGENVRYAVPEVVESAIKNLDAETAGILGSVGAFQANILRTGATALNIGFIPVNIIRDVQDALTTELSEKGAIGMLNFMASYPRAIFAAARKDHRYQEWAAAGGLQSSMMEQILKRPTKTIADLSGKRQVFKSVINSPRNLIEFANRVGEQSTRLARYKAGVQRGESVSEAAFKSRDISLDFAKAGNSIKVLNTMVPFLNAGIQGSEKLMRLYKTNPKAAVAATAITYGLPTIMLYNHNSQFQDYDDIPDAEKQSNWIIIARDRTPEEVAANEKIIGFKIPKGFLGRMAANGTESAMEFAKKRDPGAFAKAAYDTAAGISPIGLPYNLETAGRSAGQVSPPFFRAIIEGATNKNLYFGSSIVPQGLENLPPSEQYRESTPSIYKNAGKITGASPLILENTVNTTTGGLGRQIATLASGDLQGGTVGQVTRRFTDIRGGKKTDEAYETVDKEKQYTALRNKQLKEAYKNGNTEEFKRLTKGMTGQQVKSLIKNDLKKEQKKELAPVQRAYEGLSKEERMRLGKERPDLKQDLQLVEKAGAAGKMPDYDTRLKESVDESMIKTEVEMSGEPQTVNNTYYYVNEKGNVASIDMDFTVKEPLYTGNPELDKTLKSKYKGQITSKVNDVVELYNLGKITKDEAEQKIVELKSSKGSGGTGRRRKLKTNLIKVQPALKLPKPKKLRVKKVKLAKIKLDPQGAKNADKVELKI